MKIRDESRIGVLHLRNNTLFCDIVRYSRRVRANLSFYILGEGRAFTAASGETRDIFRLLFRCEKFATRCREIRIT